MQRFRPFPLLSLICLLVAPGLRADVVVTFDSLAEGDVLTTQYAPLGVSAFGSPVVLTAGSLLNEFDFPPHSLSNVLADLYGPFGFVFAPHVTAVGAFFTYAAPLELRMFRADGSLLASVHSMFSSNFGANEFLGLTYSSEEIASMTVSGDPAGASFAMDDLTFSSAVPEPSSFLLLVLVLAWAFRAFRPNRGR